MSACRLELNATFVPDAYSKHSDVEAGLARSRPRELSTSTRTHLSHVAGDAHQRFSRAGTTN